MKVQKILNSPLVLARKNANLAQRENKICKSNFNFPSYKHYTAIKQLAFSGKNVIDDISPEEKAKARAQRKLNQINEKKERIEHKKQMQEANKPICTIDEANKTIDILAKAEYPANILSNYSREETPFYIDDMPCHSLEGFFQSLKTPNIELQKELCSKSGASARHLGRQLTKASDWKKSQTLYWDNVAYKRDSIEYANLIKRAFEAKFNASETYRKALSDSKGYTLMHTCGKQDPKETVLTEEEFVNMLNMLRDRL